MTPVVGPVAFVPFAPPPPLSATLLQIPTLNFTQSIYYGSFHSSSLWTLINSNYKMNVNSFCPLIFYFVKDWFLHSIWDTPKIDPRWLDHFNFIHISFTPVPSPIVSMFQTIYSPGLSQKIWLWYYRIGDNSSLIN